MEKKKKYLGGKIHKLLNNTLARKLSKREYTQLVLLISGVFDLIDEKSTPSHN